MNRFHFEHCDSSVSESISDVGISLVSMEAEIPEVLYRGMKDFIGLNPSWDQYQLSTIFLFALRSERLQASSPRNCHHRQGWALPR